MRTISMLAALAVVLAGCSGGASVGEDVEAGADGGDRLSLGEDDPTTTTASRAADAGGTPGTQAPATTSTTMGAIPTTTPTTAPAPQEFEITINPDTGQAAQFDPSFARVGVGTTVRWRNSDTVPRSVVADDGSFESGPIAPGSTYGHRATRPGRFGYSDGTRPYAVAVLEVVTA